jgi:hypothetical protein
MRPLFPFPSYSFTLFSLGRSPENFYLHGLQRLDPATHHAPDFIDLGDDKSELLEADPFPVTYHPPKDAELFELEVEPLERRPLSPWRLVYGFQAKFDAIQCQVIHPLAEGEPMAFGKRSGAVHAPRSQLRQ